MIEGVFAGLILIGIVLMAILWQTSSISHRPDRVSVGPYVIRLGLSDARAIACGGYISQLLGYSSVRDCLRQFRTGKHLVNATLRQMLNSQVDPKDVWIQDAQGNSLNTRFQFSVKRTISHVDLQLKPTGRKHRDIAAPTGISEGDEASRAGIEQFMPVAANRYNIRQHAWDEQDFSIWLKTTYQGGIQPSYPFIVELDSGRLRIHDKLIKTLGLSAGLRWINRYRWHNALPLPWQGRIMGLPEDVNRADSQGNTFDLNALAMSTLDLSTTEGELIRFRVTASPVSLPVKTFLFGHLTRIDYHPSGVTNSGNTPPMTAVGQAGNADLANTDSHRLLNQLAVIQGSTHQLSQKYAIAEHDDYLSLIGQAIKDIRTQLVGDTIPAVQVRNKNSDQATYLGQGAAPSDEAISIALVEDEGIVAEYLSEQIVALGYQVTWYHDIAAFTEDVESGRQFQVVITDWHLGAESGAELIAYLRKNSFSGGVIVCSAEVLTTTFGIDCIMQKPIDPESFNAGLTTLVNRLFPAPNLAAKSDQNHPEKIT